MIRWILICLWKTTFSNKFTNHKSLLLKVFMFIFLIISLVIWLQAVLCTIIFSSVIYETNIEGWRTNSLRYHCFVTSIPCFVFYCAFFYFLHCFLRRVLSFSEKMCSVFRLLRIICIFVFILRPFTLLICWSINIFIKSFKIHLLIVNKG